MKKTLFLIALTVMALAVVPQAQAQIYYETFNESTGQLVSKTWIDANGNQRIENAASPGDFTINIIDLTTRIITMYRCNGRTKTYTSITINPEVEGAGMVETFLGQEMVEGRMCNHYRTTWTGRTEIEETWRDPTLNDLAIRSRIGNEPFMVRRNIRQGAQPAHLFEIPSDFRGQSVDLQNPQNLQNQLNDINERLRQQLGM